MYQHVSSCTDGHDSGQAKRRSGRERTHILYGHGYPQFDHPFDQKGPDTRQHEHSGTSMSTRIAVLMTAIQVVSVSLYVMWGCANTHHISTHII